MSDVLGHTAFMDWCMSILAAQPIGVKIRNTEMCGMPRAAPRATARVAPTIYGRNKPICV